MTEYSLTLWASGLGWRDVRVINAGDIREAIQLAESVTGCRVSHGRGGPQSQFNPQLQVDAESGQVDTLHRGATKPQVSLGPPDAVRAVAAAMSSAKSKQSNARTNDRT